VTARPGPGVIRSAFCVFAAASSGLVEDAYRRAGIPFERIVNALELERDGVVPGGKP